MFIINISLFNRKKLRSRNGRERCAGRDVTCVRACYSRPIRTLRYQLLLPLRVLHYCCRPAAATTVRALRHSVRRSPPFCGARVGAPSSVRPFVARQYCQRRRRQVDIRQQTGTRSRLCRDVKQRRIETKIKNVLRAHKKKKKMRYKIIIILFFEKRLSPVGVYAGGSLPRRRRE